MEKLLQLCQKVLSLSLHQKICEKNCVKTTNDLSFEHFLPDGIIYADIRLLFKRAWPSNHKCDCLHLC